ncbi:hypothetical protein CCR75_009829 [Bremia lactucae]|uniref:Uncharacterized protein n=1 Tax=Bremia lactucae TaxID=4779 RepID=A0A976FQM2_BRELC|nr:hypothetical protein CCR75_009829 [Bremia lactucae]
MVDSSDDATRNVLQYVIFALLLVMVLFIFLFTLWKYGSYRERLRDIIWCRDCSDLCMRRVRYDEADLRTLRELEQPLQLDTIGITGAYRMYQARQSRLSLRLASWREDVKQSGGNDDHLHHKLAQIRAVQFWCRQTQLSDNSPANRAVLTPNVPFDIRIVEITDRVNESTGSLAAMRSSEASSHSYDLDEEQPSPRNGERESATTNRRSAVTVEEEEEEKKEDVVL